ncbi:hypothetical protein MRX96_034176 [Rhipicephalus microplus]
MKVLLAITLVAILGVASGTQFSLCQAPSERRHELVNCVKTHLNEQASQKLSEQEHANTFLPDDVKTDVRAALTQCRPSN